MTFRTTSRCNSTILSKVSTQQYPVPIVIVFPSVKNDRFNLQQDLGRVCSCHALLHTTSRWRHSTGNRRSSSSWLSRNIQPNNGNLHHISREHCSLHARPDCLLHPTQIRHPARRHRIRHIQELSNMDTPARILLPDRSNRNTLLSDQRNRSALLYSAAMGLSPNLSADRTDPNDQSRRQHGPRSRRNRTDKAQPKLALIIRKLARNPISKPLFWGHLICSGTMDSRASSAPSPQIECDPNNRQSTDSASDYPCKGSTYRKG